MLDRFITVKILLHCYEMVYPRNLFEVPLEHRLQNKLTQSFGKLDHFTKKVFYEKNEHIIHTFTIVAIKLFWSKLTRTFL